MGTVLLVFSVRYPQDRQLMEFVLVLLFRYSGGELERAVKEKKGKR